MSQDQSALLIRMRAALQHLADSTSESDGSETARAYELYCEGLCAEPQWSDELERRATAVIRLCGPGSLYEDIKRIALQAVEEWRQRPSGSLGSCLALPGLRYVDPITGQWIVSSERLIQVREERRALEILLRELGPQLPRQVASPCQGWLKLCRSVEGETHHLEPDGSRGLWQLHQAELAHPDGIEAGIRELVRSGLASLKDLRRAAGALLEWAEGDAATPLAAATTSSNQNPEQAHVTKGDRRLSVNARLADLWMKRPETQALSSRKCAAVLNCSHSSIIESLTWKNAAKVRAIAKAEAKLARAKRAAGQ